MLHTSKTVRLDLFFQVTVLFFVNIRNEVEVYGSEVRSKLNIITT